jgi:hypothetical protein
MHSVYRRIKGQLDFGIIPVCEHWTPANGDVVVRAVCHVIVVSKSEDPRIGSTILRMTSRTGGVCEGVGRWGLR